jgi:hypothetical protein
MYASVESLGVCGCRIVRITFGQVPRGLGVERQEIKSVIEWFTIFDAFGKVWSSNNQISSPYKNEVVTVIPG